MPFALIFLNCKRFLHYRNIYYILFWDSLLQNEMTKLLHFGSLLHNAPLLQMWHNRLNVRREDQLIQSSFSNRFFL